MNKKILKRAGAAASLLVTLGLSACGGSDNSRDAALEPFYQQTVAWSDCSTGTFANVTPDLRPVLSGRTQCAMVRVPLDYSDVSKGSVSIGVLKVAAGTQENRLGALWTNPGGPGVSGLHMPLALSRLWLLANPANPVGAKLLRLSDSYDLIGFDPRGVGVSTTLTCSSTTSLPAVNDTDRSAEGINSQIAYDRAVAAACGGNPLTPTINTEYTARDMDVIRAALGYDKLNYYGASYGTRLGAYYADLFADRTGHMILDSLMDIGLPLPDAFLGQAPSMQYLLDGIIAPYAAAHDSYFGLGSDVDGIRQIARSGPAWLTSWLAGGLYDLLGKQDDVNGVIVHLVVSKAVGAILQGNPAISPDDLYAALDAMQFLPAAAADQEVAAHQVAINAATYYRDFLAGQTQAITLDASQATSRSVICNDAAPLHRDQPYWTSLGNALAQSSLFGGGVVGSVQHCLYWSFAPRNPPTFARAAALPLLLLQPEFDAKTPLAGARETAAILKHSKFVLQETSYTHGALFTNDACMDEYVANYLLQGSLPSGDAVCAGAGLPEPGTASAIQANIVARRLTQPADLFTDPAQAQDLQRQLRDMIR